MNDNPDPIPENSPNLPDPAHPLVVTAIDGDPPTDAFSLFQAVGRTSCGNGLFFHRNFRKWKICQRDPDNFEHVSDGWCYYPRIHEFPERITIDILRQVSTPYLKFTPDALLPLAVDDPAEVENLLRQGANPNRQPAILRDRTATVQGRLPLVVLDERIALAARWLQKIYDDLPSPEFSAVESLENLTGFDVTDPARYRPTHLSDRVDEALRRLQEKRCSRQLLREAGAFEVADYMRAVRGHCFREAEELLSAGLPVDVLQGAGCTMLSERILARDDLAVEWLLDNGANPNFRPHPHAGMTGNPVDVIEPVAHVCRQEHPRQIFNVNAGLEELTPAVLLRNDFINRYAEEPGTGAFQPLVAALLADNRPAFEKLLARGADIHAVPVFQNCVPPDWAFPRLAALEIDWLQMWGPKYSRNPAVHLWRASENRPEWAHGHAMWENHASPADRREAEECWAKTVADYNP